MATTMNLVRNLTRGLTRGLTDLFEEKEDVDLVNPVTSGLVAQYAAFQDGKTKSELVTTSGSNVSTWLDLSPNNFHLGQGTASLQPLYADVGVGMNGHPSIVLDGIDDYMRRDDLASTANAGHTVFMVVRPENKTIPEFDSLYAFNTAAFDNAYLVMLASSPLGNLIHFDADLETLVNSSVASQINIMSLVFDSADGFSWKNGVFQETFVDLFLDTASIFLLGADFDPGAVLDDWLQGQFGEFIIYDRVLTTLERQQVEAYLSDKWNIPLV